MADGGIPGGSAAVRLRGQELQQPWGTQLFFLPVAKFQFRKSQFKLEQPRQPAEFQSGGQFLKGCGFSRQRFAQLRLRRRQELQLEFEPRSGKRAQLQFRQEL